MAERLGTFQLIARELGEAWAPLEARLASEHLVTLLAELGLRFPAELTASSARLNTALGDGVAAASALPSLVEQLIDAVTNEDVAAIIVAAQAIAGSAKQILNAFDTIKAELPAAASSVGLADAEVSDFIKNLPERLADYATVLYLEWWRPQTFRWLQILGIIERTFVEGAKDVVHPPFITRALHLHRIGSLLTSPESLLNTVYGWGNPRFDHDLLLEHLEMLANALGTTPLFTAASAAMPPSLQFPLLTVQPKDGEALEIRFDAALPAAFSGTEELSPTLVREIKVQANIAAGASIVVQPPATVSIGSGASVEGLVEVCFRTVSGGKPFLIFGTQDKSRVEAMSAELCASVKLGSITPGVFGEFGAEAKVTGGRIIIDLSQADGFLTSTFPSDGFTAEFDAGIGYTNRRGVYFSGSASLETTIPVHASIGPIHFEELHLALRGSASALDAEISVSAAVGIGPVTASIDRVGTTAVLAFHRGNLGPIDLDFAFKPPTGAGIVVDAAAITGGGFLYFDEAAGRYSGVLQLEIKGISVKAVGILDTKLPGGEKGYSFLIIISAEFAPLQLGLGFTLNGVGGLAGIHRTVAIEPLQAGIRGHALDNILFPKDPVKNASRILAALQSFFPPRSGHYIFGPMALIGWGSPVTLLTVELGVIIELPPPLRIVLLGQLDCKLPKPEAAVVELHVDVLGVIDFGAKFFALDGVIHDSRLGSFSLYGDFAVRVRWGSAPSFALAIGGFHPRFHPPPEFPSLRRITLALSAGDNPRLTMQCYLALTSNSLQFGARAELYAAAGRFNVVGWVGLDVLIIYRPFSFVADIGGGFALRRGSRRIAGISVEATLTGPGPWHVWGKATISIFFFDISVHFNVTIGSGKPEAVASFDIWPELNAAVGTAGNWSAPLPPAAARVVSFAKVDGGANALIDPVGTITFVERVAPLNRTNTKFREGTPSGLKRFDLQSVKISGPSRPFHVVNELFPPAQVEQLTDDQKLSRPSFEPMAAGMALPDLVSFGPAAGMDLTYRTVVFDSPFEAHDAAERYAMTAAAQEALAGVGAAATRGMRNASSEKYVTAAAPKVTLADAAYVIASADDLKPRADLLPAAGTKSDVLLRLAEHVADHPEDRGRLLVLAADEAEAA